MSSHLVSRRGLLGGFATLPLIALVSSPPLIAACGSRPAEAPLAHLYGKDWVHGAYKLYASKYSEVQTSADASSEDAYRVIAQKGIVSLDALQTREVPFFIKVDDSERGFAIRREVPERLTFKASMTDDDRKAAEAAWKRARDHIHTDYEEIQRLDWALTRLLSQLQRIRNAIEEGRVEQYRLVEQLAELKKDPTKLPYELPFQVTPKDYEEILLLLVERLEDDAARLARLEAEVITVGVTVRTTDANSATMATSIRKVLLAIVEDGTEPARAPLFPADEGEKTRLLEAARGLSTKIEASAEFQRWRAAEREKKLEAFAAFLSTLDSMTGLPTSRVYKTVMSIWRGDNDYLGYVQTALAIIPHGSKVAAVLSDALEYTAKARKIGGAVLATVRSAGKLDTDALIAQGTALATKEAKGQVGGVLNTGSRFALERVDKQLSFFKDNTEVKAITDRLSETDLVRKAMPDLSNLSLPKGG